MAHIKFYYLIIFILLFGILAFYNYRLAKKVALLSDQQGIYSLANRFTVPFDAADLEGYRKNYTEGGVFQLVLQGEVLQSLDLTSIGEEFSSLYQKFNQAGIQGRHLITNITIVKQTDSHALVNTNALLLHTVHQDSLTLIATFNYNLTMKKVDGEWLLEKVVANVDRPLALGSEVFK